jgi:hypothetical protein
MDWLDQNAAAKAAGGTLAGLAGTGPGVARGAWHLAEGAAGGVDFVGRLLDPYDAYYSSPGQAAWGTVNKAGQDAFRYIDRVGKDPKVVMNDLRRQVHEANARLNPGATKPADTFAGELRRNFGIGLNRGEVLFDVGSLLVGGAELKGMAELGLLGRGGRASKYVARGYPPRIAEDFAKPYPHKGMGAHYYGRAEPLPKLLGGGPLPKWILDSPFNVIKPRGVDKGALYERHYKTDLQYHGGPLPGGGGWSGRKLGWRKYGPVGRAYYGAPGPLKSALAGGLAGVGAVVDKVFERK